jgi:hypothetical protein
MHSVGKTGFGRYDHFSSDGIVITANQDLAGASNHAHATIGGTPIFHHLSDFPPGLSVEAAAKQVVGFAAAAAARSAPQFGVFRTILQPATYHYNVAAAATATAGDGLVWVDPITMGVLAKIELAADAAATVATSAAVEG